VCFVWGEAQFLQITSKNFEDWQLSDWKIAENAGALSAFDIKIVTLFIQSFLFLHGSTALVGPGHILVEASRSHSDTSHSVGLLWRCDRSVAGISTDNAHTHTHTHETAINASGGIRTRNSSNRAATDPRLKPRSHLNRPKVYWETKKSTGPVNPSDNKITTWVNNWRHKFAPTEQINKLKIRFVCLFVCFWRNSP